jgi:hypothetical protein
MRRIDFLAAAIAACICAGCARGTDPSTAAQGLRPGRIDRTIDVEASGGEAARLLALIDGEPLRALRRASRPASAAWRNDADAESARIERIRSAEQAARTALIRIFGDAARESPAFWRLFAPLNDRVPELDPAAQIAIHDLERGFLAARLAGEDPLSFAEHLAKVRNTVGAASAVEYALRTSPAAAALRNAGIDLTENEFREAYDILAALPETADGVAFIEARRRLRRLLGNLRFARLWSQQDPRYAQLTAIAADFDIPDDTLVAGYAVLVESQDAMVETALRDTAGQRPGQQRLRSMHERGRRRLAEIVGSAAADAMLRAWSRRPEPPGTPSRN